MQGTVDETYSKDCYNNKEFDTTFEHRPSRQKESVS